ncbi:GNAT family N-acetyltransferase [Methanospirillum lacunae]|uniref:GNAT family N-acetyltransferase n=1 Tax=Methanospirillum lacunae TaxID=668570 RepID=A0A2V2MYA8_9EURY|nr:GNAT family N-acetyltransferase [Methanospirillum lacunae]PWR71285.1 GNAT family N-acetyltransferase [Methanospirillum lacunae]
MTQACSIVADNYREEREFVPEIPVLSEFFVPEIFLKNGLGVAAIDDGDLIGFLCGFGPIDNQFGDVKGVFSPLHGHGAIQSDRKKIYSLLYSYAAKIWVKKEIFSHSIALYAHDNGGITSFFQNGFGMRCIDAIRSFDPISTPCLKECSYYEITTEKVEDIVPLNNALILHMHQSPIFMPIKHRNQAEIVKDVKEGLFRYFCAFKDGTIIGYMKVGGSGENFISRHNSMVNICGAYLLPEYRGQGIASQLLSYILSQMQREGYDSVGVDFESINPQAREFWLRFFTPYTNSLVRRIDERSTTTSID